MSKIAWFRELPTASTGWQCFSDIENELIEEAFAAKCSSIELDECNIDFIQEIARTNDGEAYTVQRRMVNSRERNQCAYQQRFSLTEQPISRSFDTFSHENPSLIWKWMLQHNLKPRRYRDLSRPKYIWVLNQAADGIIIEGAQLNRKKEAEWIGNQLRDLQQSDVDKIHIRVVFLYTCESFLYKLLNQQLRAQDTSKTETLGPFAYLLWLSWIVTTFHAYNYSQRIYRGAHLDEHMIEQYRQASDKGLCAWLGFTSTSKSRALAELYGGNTQFIIDFDSVKPPHFEAIDISTFSNFNSEEEVLLPERNCFRVDKIEKDVETQKNTIYIVICDPNAYPYQFVSAKRLQIK